MANAGLSVVIPTLNEEKDLPATLASVEKLADEVLVIDSGSTDGTLDIAQKFGARVVNHPFISFSDTRNFGDSQASGDWILSIEADVTITSDLAREIQEAISSDDIKAYFIGRENIIWGKKVLHTDWGPNDDCHIWLYKKNVGSWQSLVHEEFVTREPVGKLKHHLVHKNYETVSEFIDKIDRYSSLAVKQNQHVSSTKFIYDFLKRYFYKKGFLDGFRGLFLSYLQAVYYLTLTVKRYTKST